MELPQKIQDVVKAFSRLPGVGEKTALRQTLIMSKWMAGEITELARAIENLKTLGKCHECGMYCDEKICIVCADEQRTQSAILCVVENLNDCLAIEKSATFKGLYHVLGGVLNPLLGVGPDELSLDRLAERVKKYHIKEIILAVNPSVEGDATCALIKEMLPVEVQIQRIGFGIPMGGSLEYLDSLTISKALENRRQL
jgi:recombination protein RecR